MTANYTCRVLVADDEAAMLQAYRSVLEPPQASSAAADIEAELFGDGEAVSSAASFEVVYCRQGDEAIEAVRQASEQGRPFRIAFLDVRMPPGLSGVEAAEQIRCFDPGLHIVFVTAYSDVPLPEIARRVPPPERLFHVAKPFQPPELLQIAAALTPAGQALACGADQGDRRH